MAIATRHFPTPPWAVSNGRWYWVVVCKCGARYNEARGIPTSGMLCGQCGEEEWLDHKRRVGRWVEKSRPIRTWRRWFRGPRVFRWEFKEKSTGSSPPVGPPNEQVSKGGRTR